jgi:prephenate dehydratase
LYVHRAALRAPEESMTRIAYQGAPGAYSELAARTLYPRARPVPCVDFAAVVRAVTSGTTDLGILPVTNTIIGAVTEARDALAAASAVTVVNHLSLPVRHCLLALPGATPETLRWVESHPAALAQCARWLASQRLNVRAVADTAGAAQAIAADRDYTRAAIAGVEAASHYGLAIIAENIADAADNQTEFVVVARAAEAAA